MRPQQFDRTKVRSMSIRLRLQPWSVSYRDNVSGRCVLTFKNSQCSESAMNPHVNSKRSKATPIRNPRLL